MTPELVEVIITVLTPTSATIFTAWLTYRQSSRHSAKHSILQLILEDQFNWLAFKQLPRNYSAILKEYEIYHKNGGNGEVTARVDDYKAWHSRVESEKNT